MPGLIGTRSVVFPFKKEERTTVECKVLCKDRTGRRGWLLWGCKLKEKKEKEEAQVYPHSEAEIRQKFVVSTIQDLDVLISYRRGVQLILVRDLYR